MDMTKILIKQRGMQYPDPYYWSLYATNGKFLAKSCYYVTKFHCKKAAGWAFPTFTIINQTKDGRLRA